MSDKLITERNRAFEAAKAVLDAAEAEGRALSAEESQSVERAFADIDAIKATLDASADLAKRQAEREAAEEAWASVARPTKVHSADGVDPVEAELMAFLAGERRSVTLDVRSVARERRAIRAGHTGRELRDMTVGTTTAGGNTVPTSFLRELYDYLEVFSGMRRTNAMIITTAGGENLEMPKVTSHGTAAIVGEGTALAEADPAVGKLTLGSWKYGQLLQISNELLTDTGVDLLGFIARDCGRAIARATDAHYVTGNGTNQPLGIMAACGTGVTGGTGVGGSATFDNLLDLLYSVNEEYRANGAQWFMKDATAGGVRRLKDSYGQYLWQPSLVEGQPDRLLNYPVITDPNVAAAGTNNLSVAFGDFSTYVIRDVGSVRLERSDEFAFDKDIVTYRCVFRTDGDLLDLTGAVKAYKGGTA
jgi:HK97 family phage major capsid protein